MSDTPAHDQVVTIKFREHWGEHPPRKDDPHNKIFEQTKKRLRKLGQYHCAIAAKVHGGQLEAHHSMLEDAHALARDYDLAKVDEVWHLDLKTDEELLAYINGPGGLEILCALHHRGQIGIHSLPEPQWNAVRVARDDSTIVAVMLNTEIPVVKV